MSVTSASATLAQGTQAFRWRRRRRALPGGCAARFQSPAGLQVWRKGADAPLRGLQRSQQRHDHGVSESARTNLPPAQSHSARKAVQVRSGVRFLRDQQRARRAHFHAVTIVLMVSGTAARQCCVQRSFNAAGESPDRVRNSSARPTGVRNARRSVDCGNASHSGPSPALVRSIALALEATSELKARSNRVELAVRGRKGPELV